MYEDYEDGELDPLETRHDPELTLSTTTLIAIFFGLVLLCSLCFGLGYTVGHRSSTAPVAATAPPAVTTTPDAETLPKPAPTATDNVPQPATPPVADTSAATPAPVTNTAPAEPVTHPALPQQTSPGKATPAAVNNSRATASQPLMVQIAIVSHQEDADVLVGALRKHGYTANAQRDLSDDMLHVRIGPFTSRDDANTLRQKLLNDGFNAVVQP